MKLDLTNCGVPAELLEKKRPDAEKAMDALWSGALAYTGWVRLPLDENPGELERILDAAARIAGQCDLLVVLGAGGSSLGARAVIDAIGTRDGIWPRLMFAGDNLDTDTLLRVGACIRRVETCLCVISKSGTTVETLVAFSVLKEVMKEKYGKAAAGRIYAVTDARRGLLREEADREGYVSFAVPEDIGGRYSVLSPVGLLPLAAGGVDIRRLLSGAKDMAQDPRWDHGLGDYAIARVCLGEAGKTLEAMESFDPAMENFGQWLKQLFGESEGKEGKGIYPTVLSFTRDLHSVGQYLQEGRQIFFETMILFEGGGEDIVIPESAGALLAGLTVREVNDCVAKGVLAAHTKAGIPLVTLTLPIKDAYALGQLIYFFEMSCGLSALMTGVDPFNQPGVERYKEEAREEIRKRAEKNSKKDGQLV